MVVSSPHALDMHGHLACTFKRELLQSGMVQELSWHRTKLFSVCAVESSRGAKGLSEINVVLSLDERGRVHLCGEYGIGFITINETHDEVHIWNSPAKFRGSNFRLDLMREVLQDMRACTLDWSWATAVRAFMLSSNISNQQGGLITIKDIEQGWQAEPICTSIVVIFWQRYFHKLASAESRDPLSLILEFMPLKADRVLPGELLTAMLSHGWSLWQTPGGRTTANRS